MTAMRSTISAPPDSPWPTVPGSVEFVDDDRYLAEALRRGAREPRRCIESQILTGGRTGASVTAVRTEGGKRFVVKQIPEDRGFSSALGTRGEGPLWLSGGTRAIPEPAFNPTLDVAYHEVGQEWWLLMDDISSGLVERGAWTEAHSRRLFQAIARLHARYWQRKQELAQIPLAPLPRTTAAMAEVAFYVGGGGPAREHWVPQGARDYQVPGVLLPRFLEVLGPRDADNYLELTGNWRHWHESLEHPPFTLLHGDLRRANIAFLGREIGLIDWEFAACGHPAADLQWHGFLHYWAYAPDGRFGDRPALREHYLDCVEQILGTRINRSAFTVAWEVAWLRAFVQLGYCLADGIGDGADDSESTWRRAACRAAIQRACKIAESHVG